MKTTTTTLFSIALAVGALSSPIASGATVAELEKRIADLEAKMAPSSSEGSVAQNLDSSFGTSTLSDFAAKTTIGGYGELHLNINRGGDDEIDFHRWVLFLNHRFNDRVKLVSEFELEHSLSGDGKSGEVELEQAYIEFDLNDLSAGLTTRAGLFLIPVGMLNETHEPNTFFGVERNNVEKNIIPTTWWEAGLGLSKNFDNGLGIDWAIHSGLNVSNDVTESNAFRLRSGRQKVSEAIANSWASTLRLRYTGIEGLSLSGFVQYQSDLTQDDPESNDALLYGATADYRKGGFGLKALVAYWDINGTSFEANDADSQWGGYVEPSYTWTLANDHKVGVFARYSHYEYARAAGNTEGGEFDEYSAGLNYWPLDNVVFKTDYTIIEKDGGSSNESLNFGVGYAF